jgi:hypothetical protein
VVANLLKANPHAVAVEWIAIPDKTKNDVVYYHNPATEAKTLTKPESMLIRDSHATFSRLYLVKFQRSSCR